MSKTLIPKEKDKGDIIWVRTKIPEAEWKELTIGITQSVTNIEVYYNKEMICRTTKGDIAQKVKEGTIQYNYATAEYIKNIDNNYFYIRIYGGSSSSVGIMGSCALGEKSDIFIYEIRRWAAENVLACIYVILGLVFMIVGVIISMTIIGAIIGIPIVIFGFMLAVRGFF
jgi:hypothetical protein